MHSTGGIKLETASKKDSTAKADNILKFCQLWYVWIFVVAILIMIQITIFLAISIAIAIAILIWIMIFVKDKRSLLSEGLSNNTSNI